MWRWLIKMLRHFANNHSKYQFHKTNQWTKLIAKFQVSTKRIVDLFVSFFFLFLCLLNEKRGKKQITRVSRTSIHSNLYCLLFKYNNIIYLSQNTHDLSQWRTHFRLFVCTCSSSFCTQSTTNNNVTQILFFFQKKLLDMQIYSTFHFNVSIF